MTLCCVGVSACELGASTLGCEHPVDAGARFVALFFPGGDFGDEAVFFVHASVEALALTRVLSRDASDFKRYWKNAAAICLTRERPERGLREDERRGAEPIDIQRRNRHRRGSRVHRAPADNSGCGGTLDPGAGAAAHCGLLPVGPHFGVAHRRARARGCGRARRARSRVQRLPSAVMRLWRTTRA